MKKDEKKGKRFARIYRQGAVSCMEIWVDRETGVHYLLSQNGYGGGITVLLDEKGQPVVDKKVGE